MCLQDTCRHSAKRSIYKRPFHICPGLRWLVVFSFKLLDGRNCPSIECRTICSSLGMRTLGTPIMVQCSVKYAMPYCAVLCSAVPHHLQETHLPSGRCTLGSACTLGSNGPASPNSSRQCCSSAGRGRSLYYSVQLRL